MIFDETHGGSDAEPVLHHLLLIEDDPADVRLIAEGLEAGDIDCRIDVVPDGEEGLDFLGGRGDHEAAPRPDLVLVDLDVSETGGYAFLERVRKESVLRRVPVIVFTSARPLWEIDETYQLHADSFASEPLDLPRLMGALRGLGSYWLRIAHLPGPRHEASPPTQRR